MLQDWQQRFPSRIDLMSKALQNVVPLHLADNGQFDFVGLKNQSVPFKNGDSGFYPPELTSQHITGTNKVTPLAITNI